MADLKDFADKLVGLTVKEVNELASILKSSGSSGKPRQCFHHLDNLK